MNDEQHVFLLYHHRELNRVLETLSVVFDRYCPGLMGRGRRYDQKERVQMIPSYCRCFMIASALS